jgi:hypothetical protein
MPKAKMILKCEETLWSYVKKFKKDMKLKTMNEAVIILLMKALADQIPKEESTSQPKEEKINYAKQVLDARDKSDESLNKDIGSLEVIK